MDPEAHRRLASLRTVFVIAHDAAEAPMSVRGGEEIGQSRPAGRPRRCVHTSRGDQAEGAVDVFERHGVGDEAVHADPPSTYEATIFAIELHHLRGLTHPERHRRPDVHARLSLLPDA